MIHRRSMLTGILAFGAAPAIVRADSLMRIRPRLIVTPNVTREMLERILREISPHPEGPILRPSSLAPIYRHDEFGAYGYVSAIEHWRAQPNLNADWLAQALKNNRVG